MPSLRINLLIDLSGTLHIGDAACPGAIGALSKLSKAASRSTNAGPPGTKNEASTSASSSSSSKRRNVSVGIRFCSNTTKESSSDLQKRLLRAGFAPSDVSSARITTSLEACKTLCVRQRWRPFLLLTPSAQETFREKDASDVKAFFPDPTRTPAQLTEQERCVLRACDTVVVGLAPSLFNAEWLNEAFRILSEEYGEDGLEAGPRTRLVATHRAMYVRPAPDEPLCMGPGAYVTALEAATRRKAEETIVCGKPSMTFLQMCLDGLRDECPTDEREQREERNIIVGDDIDADLGGGAIELGLERILVQTGKYRRGDEARSPADHPVKVYASFAEFVEQELFADGLLEA